MATENIQELEQTFKDAQTAYRAARKELAVVINKAEDSDAMDELVASSEELGLNATLHRLKTKNPKVAEAITRLNEASHHLGHAVNARENARIEIDPKHQRVFIEDGREFTLDVEKGLWTYLDDPDNPIKITLTKESKLPYDLPGFKGPDIDPPKPAKKKKLQQRM
jgi:adenylosuccinate synthase